MSLFDRLKIDNKRILSVDMRDVTLYNSEGVSLSGQGRFTAIGMTINPQGQMVGTKTWTIAFHIEDFNSIMGTNESFKNWQAEFLDSEGATIKGRFNNPLVDKTLGYVVATLTKNRTV